LDNGRDARRAVPASEGGASGCFKVFGLRDNISYNFGLNPIIFNQDSYEGIGVKCDHRELLLRYRSCIAAFISSTVIGFGCFVCLSMPKSAFPECCSLVIITLPFSRRIRFYRSVEIQKISDFFRKGHLAF
jgi:hypothetical protein